MNCMDVKVGVCLFVEDIEKMVSYYKDILGFETEWKSGEKFADFKTNSGPLSLFMYDRKDFASAVGESYYPPKGINLTMEIGVWLPCFSDVDKEYERLNALGIKSFSGEPVTYPFGIRNFYIADPEGNLLEIGSNKKDEPLLSEMAEPFYTIEKASPAEAKRAEKRIKEFHNDLSSFVPLK